MLVPVAADARAIPKAEKPVELVEETEPTLLREIIAFVTSLPVVVVVPIAAGVTPTAIAVRSPVVARPEMVLLEI